MAHVRIDRDLQIIEHRNCDDAGKSPSLSRPNREGPQHRVQSVRKSSSGSHKRQADTLEAYEGPFSQSGH